MVKLLKVKPFKQSPGFCGPAVLKVVLEFFGLKKNEAELARLSGATREGGVGARGLAKVGRQLGFKVLIKDFSTFADIRNYVIRNRVPVIVDWFSTDEGHYSVVVGIDRRNIYLQDPELGRLRKMDLKTFKRVWFDFSGEFLQSKANLNLRRLIVLLPR